MAYRVGVITDIVRSRELSDRAGAQAAIRACFDRAHTVAPAVEPLWATAGDEFQSVYARVEDALVTTLLVRTLLPEGLDCRFGIGEGDIRRVESGANGHDIQDGPAWWNAREAITAVHAMQDRGQAGLRTWFVGNDPAQQGLVNALLLGRDHVVSRMKSRERRLAAEYFAGRTQQAIAQSEKISQAAVSQNLRRSGATALALGMDVLKAGPRS